MKRNKLIAKMLLVACIAQVPNMSNALNVKAYNIEKSYHKSETGIIPKEGFTTQYDDFKNL